MEKIIDLHTHLDTLGVIASFIGKRCDHTIRLEEHIKDGKKELNFSEFGAYSNRKQKSKLKFLISQVKDDKMPISSYALIHSNAKLSESEKKEIMDWATTLRDSLK